MSMKSRRCTMPCSTRSSRICRHRRRLMPSLSASEATDSATPPGLSTKSRTSRSSGGNAASASAGRIHSKFMTHVKTCGSEITGALHLAAWTSHSGLLRFHYTLYLAVTPHSPLRFCCQEVERDAISWPRRPVYVLDSRPQAQPVGDGCADWRLAARHFAHRNGPERLQRRRGNSDRHRWPVLGHHRPCLEPLVQVHLYRRQPDDYHHGDVRTRGFEPLGCLLLHWR